MDIKTSGIEPGQRRLNGPQTTGREYRNLSQPTFAMAEDDDVPVPMRDGVTLLADVHRPAQPGRYPVLIAASPYPRQIQNLGAPAGFIEAGASDFFVPRGYVHVIANCRGTGGSGGTFGFFDSQERHDMHDLVEWAAQQPWSDGNVGMIGASATSPEPRWKLPSSVLRTSKPSCPSQEPSIFMSRRPITAW
jgi:predicted acyl esterase